jgi:[ribosomal protein S5]-alanine N-acetyltransferase
MQPDLLTTRLRLRSFLLTDSTAVQRLAGHAAVADTTLTIPHPYPDGAAEAWISSHGPKYTNNQEITYAVTLQTTGQLLGAISLIGISLKDSRCEFGYWIGHDYWSNGYCTEAAARMLIFANEHLGITRFVARCMARNPASARVMIKLAMHPEGHLLQHTLKNGVYEDILVYGRNLPSRAGA